MGLLNVYSYMNAKTVKLTDTYQVFLYLSKTDYELLLKGANTDLNQWTSDYGDNKRIELFECTKVKLPCFKYKEESYKYGNFRRNILIPDYESVNDLELSLLEHYDNPDNVDSPNFDGTVNNNLLSVQGYVDLFLNKLFDTEHFAYKLHDYIPQIDVVITTNDFTDTVLTYTFKNLKLTNYSSYTLDYSNNSPIEWSLSFAFQEYSCVSTHVEKEIETTKKQEAIQQQHDDMVKPTDTRSPNLSREGANAQEAINARNDIVSSQTRTNTGADGHNETGGSNAADAYTQALAKAHGGVTPAGTDSTTDPNVQYNYEAYPAATGASANPAQETAMQNEGIKTPDPNSQYSFPDYTELSATQAASPTTGVDPAGSAPIETNPTINFGMDFLPEATGAIPTTTEAPVAGVTPAGITADPVIDYNVDLSVDTSTTDAGHQKATTLGEANANLVAAKAASDSYYAGEMDALTAAEADGKDPNIAMSMYQMDHQAEYAAAFDVAGAQAEYNELLAETQNAANAGDAAAAAAEAASQAAHQAAIQAAASSRSPHDAITVDTTLEPEDNGDSEIQFSDVDIIADHESNYGAAPEEIDHNAGIPGISPAPVTEGLSETNLEADNSIEKPSHEATPIASVGLVGMENTGSDNANKIKEKTMSPTDKKVDAAAILGIDLNDEDVLDEITPEDLDLAKRAQEEEAEEIKKDLGITKTPTDETETQRKTIPGYLQKYDNDVLAVLDSTKTNEQFKRTVYQNNGDLPTVGYGTASSAGDVNLYLKNTNTGEIKHITKATQMTSKYVGWELTNESGNATDEEAMKLAEIQTAKTLQSKLNSAKTYAKKAGLDWSTLTTAEKGGIIEGAYNGSTGALVSNAIKYRQSNPNTTSQEYWEMAYNNILTWKKLNSDVNKYGLANRANKIFSNIYGETTSWQVYNNGKNAGMYSNRGKK